MTLGEAVVNLKSAVKHSEETFDNLCDLCEFGATLDKWYEARARETRAQQELREAILAELKR